MSVLEEVVGLLSFTVVLSSGYFIFRDSKFVWFVINRLEFKKNTHYIYSVSVGGTVQVLVWSEPMGGAISAPLTENRMSDLQMSFKVLKKNFIL